MLLRPIVGGIATALLVGGVSAAACTANYLIDNFNSWSSGKNTLGGTTGDDSTLAETNTTGGILTFTPEPTSYIYESFPCTDTVSRGYDSISFTIKGPYAASVSIELQTRTDCSATTYKSYYHTVNGLTGAIQTVTVPLSSWTGANLNAVTGMVWYGFSEGLTGTDHIWQLDNLQLDCASIEPAHSKNTLGSLKRYQQPDVALRDLQGKARSCQLAVIDDWVSQSRLTFLFYNAMLKPTSDDGSMKSVVVANNRVTLTPKTSSYFYSQVGCFDAQDYGGISLRIKAAAGTSFSVQLSSSKDGSCDGSSTTDVVLTTQSLGWTFNGNEKLYSIPFSKFPGLDLSNFSQMILSDLSKAVTLGPVALYCGSSVAEYVAPPVVEPTEPTGTVVAPSSTATPLVIDTFASKETNALGQWHGGDDGIKATFGSNTVTLQTSSAELTWQTQLTATCRDIRQWDGAYIHIAYKGSNKFSVVLQQHNEKCDSTVQPYPATWDSLEAARYATATDIYIPVNHFNVDRSRIIGVAFRGFYSTQSTTFSKIEFVDKVPSTFKVPLKLPSGKFVFACKRPNSFAFAIDDGDPALAQQVIRTIDEAGFKATFFTVGAALLDPSTNLSNVYHEMQSKGHQIALHSYTHPPLEGLPDEASIDWEYNNDLKAVTQVFGSAQNVKYFRAPFGVEGARMRQRYAALVPDPYIVQWSVDVEDWRWAETSTPEKQIDAFRRDVAAGGTITVMHYLYNTTVSYLPQLIQIAKDSGKQLMRVDQCMMDPNAPPL
ncbi:hypothetical protein GGR50DRAFT_569238 [Xylaria sp. CBS 124048]|nr:hypothetical protein GGR50DRAFT_569238 [Xylaria sp. CBS 124048]